jgi:hypothetical protein
MKHLSREHLIELVEDPGGASLPLERRRHVEACARCGQEAATLRAALTEIRGDPGAEPSPLFWDHFPARVADAIRDALPDRDATGAASRFGARGAAWTAVALTVVLGCTMVAWRATLHAPTVQTIAADDDAREDDLESDQAWNIVRAAADGVQWEDVQLSAMGARPGAAERVVMELTPDERAELARLIETELRRSGA